MSEPAAPASSVAGAQSLQRSVALLRLVARHGPEGARLLDLARASALNQPTARRILKALTEEGLLARTPVGRRYRLGPLAAELGLAASPPPGPSDRTRGMAARLSRRIPGAVVVQARSGPDTVCLLRTDAPGSTMGQGLAPGTRRPLGSGAGPLAMLASLDESDLSAALEALRLEAYFAMGQELRELRRAVTATRSRGWAASPEMLMPGVVSVGVMLPRDAPAQLSLSVLEHEPTPDRIDALAALLRREIAKAGYPPP